MKRFFGVCLAALLLLLVVSPVLAQNVNSNVLLSGGSVTGGGGGFVIGGIVIGGTPGSIIFVGAGAIIAQDNACFFWNQVSQQLELCDGTAALPSYTFKADPDTGIFRVGANSLGVTTAGAVRLTVDTNVVVGGGAVATQVRFLEPSASGTNFSSFSAVAQGADINYTLPPAIGVAGAVLTHAAADGVLTWAAVTGFANTALSNLAAVAVNASLVPGVDNTIDLGSSALRWKTLHVGPASVIVHNDATNTLKVSLDFSGATAQLITDAATPLQLTTGANTGLAILTGGDITVGGDAAASAIRFLEPSGSGVNFTSIKAQAQAGDVAWILPAAQGAASTFLQNDGAGTLSWTAVGGFANTALSNLAAVAINTSLLPGADNAIAVGSSTLRFTSVNATSHVVRNDATDTQKVTLDFSGANAGRIVSDATSTLQITTGANTGLIILTGGDTTVGGGVAASAIRFLEPSGSGVNFSAIKAQAQGADITYTLPPTVGAAGTVLTDAAGTGSLTWAAAGAGSVTGSGTPGKIPKWASSSSLTDSLIAESGTNIGIGTTSPDARLRITAGTLTSTSDHALNVSGTFLDSTTSQIMMDLSFTSAGTGIGQQTGLYLALNPGYTAGVGGITSLYEALNEAAGGGNGDPRVAALGGGSLQAGGFNAGAWSLAVGNTALCGCGLPACPGDTGPCDEWVHCFGIPPRCDGVQVVGTNIGAMGMGAFGAVSYGVVGQIGFGSYATRPDSDNIGVGGFSTSDLAGGSTTEKHIGITGQALNGNINVGGYFGLQTGLPTYVSAALIADNGAVTAPIFVARDNGTQVGEIANGGDVNLCQTTGTNLTLGGGATAGKLRFLEPSGSGTNVSTFAAQAQTADINYTLPPTVGAAGTVLTDAAGTGSLTWAGAGSVTGSGTPGKIPKWSSSTALTDSILTESGTLITIAGTQQVGTAALGVLADVGATYAQVYVTSTTNTHESAVTVNNASGGASLEMDVFGTTGPGTFLGITRADAAILRSTGASNLLIGTSEVTSLTIGTNDIARLTIDGTTGVSTFTGNVVSNGNFDWTPATDNNGHLGTDSLRWNRVRAVTVVTGDLEMRDDAKGAHWVLVEEPDGIVAKNMITGKRYSIAMTAIKD